jgi:hypothetical protein
MSIVRVVLLALCAIMGLLGIPLLIIPPVGIVIIVGSICWAGLLLSWTPGRKKVSLAELMAKIEQNTRAKS